MWAGLSVNQPLTIDKIFNTNDLYNHRCSICNRYYETIMDRTFVRHGIPHRFKNICFYCCNILEKAFLI